MTDDEDRVEKAERKEVLSAAELQQLYEEQQRRLACPGCGEEPFLG